MSYMQLPTYAIMHLYNNLAHHQSDVKIFT